MTFKDASGKPEVMKTDPNTPYSDELAQRKGAHIELAARSITSISEVDHRFNYEPLFFSHPTLNETWKTSFLDFEFDYPIWISSMTGGTLHAKSINKNLATLCEKYRLGMGLGSCRPLLNDRSRLSDFAVRKYLKDRPLFANLGIAQIEEFLGEEEKVHELVKMLEADGLIIHLNPLQEWFQPEGDRYILSPLETLERFMNKVSYKVIVKEVGQGLGPKSLASLLELPISAIEFGAFGGTNFSMLENLRGEDQEQKRPFIKVGHTASEMVGFLNALPTRNKEFIISGGMSNVLDGYELMMLLKSPSVLGMAQPFLAPAMESFESLEKFFLRLRESLLVAKNILSLKGE